MNAEAPKFANATEAIAAWEQDKLRARQDFYKDMYQTGKRSPYQKDRPGIDLKKEGEAWKDPATQGETSRIMAVDIALRGGADKEYNQLGDMGHRAQRMAVMVENMLPNIALDILTSIPANLADKAVTDVLKGKIEVAKKLGDSLDNKKLVDRLNFQLGSFKAFARLFSVMNDKNVTAFGDTLMKWRTGEKQGWFTGESSDKLNDLVTAGYPERIEDFVNGPTIESAFRILYQIPVLGALIEQLWTRWTLFQSKSAYHKGNLKGAYAAAGMFIGILRKVDEKDMKTPSWWITNKLWEGGERVFRKSQAGAVSTA